MSITRKSYLASVMREANIIKKSARIPRRDAMKKGYLVAALNAILATGAMAHISFVKADGTIREMNALRASVGEHLITGTGKSHTPTANMLLVDADISEFRSLKKCNLLTVRKAA